MSTDAVVTLISAVVYPLMPASSNRRTALIQILSDCSIWLTSLFQSYKKTSFKLWHLFVICKNPSVMYCYNQRKIFTVEMQQKFLPSAWESLLISTCWIRSYDAQELSFIGHQILIVYMFGLNVFAYEISLQSDNSFLVSFFIFIFIYFLLKDCMSEKTLV